MNKKRRLVIMVIAVATVLFLASSCTTSTNNQPIITSLEPEGALVVPSGSVQVVCAASDPDGDELSYEWSTSGGDISGTSSVASWSAPQEVGTYSVTVVVRDGYGGEATGSVSLSVTLGTSPTIERLCISPKGHVYLRESTAGCDYDVWKEKGYDIECIVSDTSGGVSYEWSCTGGSISGQGSMITWTAPNQLSVAVTVTVTVRNVVDQMTETIDLCVPSCTCGSWGLELGCK